MDTFPLQKIPEKWLSYECVLGHELQPEKFPGTPRLVEGPTRKCVIETKLKARLKRLKMKGVYFSQLRDTSVTFVYGNHHQYRDSFCRHSAPKMARFYTDGDEVRCTGLDHIIDELEKRFAPTLDIK